MVCEIPTSDQRRFVEEYLVDLNAVKAASRIGMDLKPFSLPAPSRFYVYFLANPETETIFYIGKGKERRILVHEAEAAASVCGGNVEKTRKIRDIKKSHDEVNKYIFEHGMSEGDAYALERYFIKSIEIHLTNISSGQQSEDERNALSAQMLLDDMISLEDWCAIRPRSEFEISLHHRTAAELKKLIDYKNVLNSFVGNASNVISCSMHELEVRLDG